MDFSDALGSLLPFLIFTVIVVLGNLSDKKKPPVKKRSAGFPKGMKLPDIQPPSSKDKSPIEIVLEQPVPMPAKEAEEESAGEMAHSPHHPDEYEAVHNSYQQYLAKKKHQPQEYQERHSKPSEDKGLMTERNAPSAEGISLRQAILAAEILGKPRSLQRRRK